MTPELAARYEKLYRFVAVIKPEVEVPPLELIAAQDGDMSDLYLLLGDIGSRIGETRRPLSAKQLKELFRLVEFELAGPDGDFANAVATGLLEAVFESSISGGFDLETIKQIIGRRARDYLHSWAESHGREIEGLSKT